LSSSHAEEGSPDAFAPADPLVHAVVLNYRSAGDTVECVRALERITYGNFRIVVIDNHSEDGSEETLREAFPHHRIIQSGRNLGYAAGNNVGLRIALEEGAGFALILNSDTIVEPDFLTRLIDYAKNDPLAGVLSPLILSENGEVDRRCTRRTPTLLEIFWNYGIGNWIRPNRSWFERGRYIGEYDFDDPREVEVVSGSCMLLRTDLLREIELLDEHTFLFWEEFILAEQVGRTRYRTVLVPESRIVHKLGGTVRRFPTRLAISFLGSLHYYLKRYRGVSWLVRWIIVLSAGTLKTPLLLRGMRIRWEAPSTSLAGAKRRGTRS
jgi:GT2 family glycosyltransferase